MTEAIYHEETIKPPKKSFKELVIDDFESYKKEVEKDWVDEMQLGKEDYCNCCNKKTRITLHHLVPQRVLRRVDPTIARFLENQKIKLCPDCHCLFHPENRWKGLLIKQEKGYEAWAQDIEQDHVKELKEKEKEVAQIKQEQNNQKIKHSELKKAFDVQAQQINELKKNNATQKKNLSDKNTELEQLKRELFCSRLSKEKEALTFFNCLRAKDQNYILEYRKEIQPSIMKALRECKNSKLSNRMKLIAKRQLSYNCNDIKFASEQMEKLHLKIINEVLRDNNFHKMIIL